MTINDTAKQILSLIAIRELEDILARPEVQKEMNRRGLEINWTVIEEMREYERLSRN